MDPIQKSSPGFTLYHPEKTGTIVVADMFLFLMQSSVLFHHIDNVNLIYKLIYINSPVQNVHSTDSFFILNSLKF